MKLTKKKCIFSFTIQIGEKWIHLHINFHFAYFHSCIEFQFGKCVNSFTRLRRLNIIFFKHKLSLCFISHLIPKIWRSGCTGPWILNFNSRWRWVVSIVHQPLYLQRKSFWIGGWMGPSTARNWTLFLLSSSTHSLVPIFLPLHVLQFH